LPSSSRPRALETQVVAVEVPQTLRPASKSSRGGLSSPDLSLSPDLNLSLSPSVAPTPT